MSITALAVPDPDAASVTALIEACLAVPVWVDDCYDLTEALDMLDRMTAIETYLSRRGQEWRVIAGKKAPDDLLIQWYVNERWVPVSLDSIFVAVDLICQNEDVLYPFPLKGGQMTVQAINKARIDGFEHASGWLHLQRQNRQQLAAEVGAT